MISSLIRVFQNIGPKLRNKAILLLILSLIVIPIEFLGIAVIIPIFSVIFETTTQNNSIINFEFLNPFFNHENKIGIILIMLIIIFFAKNVFLTIFFKLKFSYIFLIQKEISRLLFFKYLSSSYNFHLQNDSSTIIRNISTEINIFTRSFFLSVLDLTLESIILITICVFLLMYDPQTTILIIIVLILTTYITDKVKKKKINNFAIQKQSANKYVLQLISAVFNGIKEVKINVLERKMLKAFDKLNSVRLLNDEKISFYAAVPRLLFEFICILVLVGIILIKKDDGTNIGEAIAVYTFAIFRIMPSFIRLSIILQNIRVSKPSVKIIEEHLFDNKNQILLDLKKNEEIINKINNNQLHKFNHVKFSIDKFTYDKEIIFENFDLDIKANDKICISGKSGSGKSTLINIITGLVNCENLKISLDGKKIENNELFQKSSFSYMPQTSTIFQTTIEENITLFDNNIDFEKYKKAILLSRCDFIENFKEKSQTIVAEEGGNMSGGQLQRIFIARAIYSNKKILIFDESTNQLDHYTENEIVNDIVKLPQTIIFVTHKEKIKEKFSKIVEVDKI